MRFAQGLIIVSAAATGVRADNVITRLWCRMFTCEKRSAGFLAAEEQAVPSAGDAHLTGNVGADAAAVESDMLKSIVFADPTPEGPDSKVDTSADEILASASEEIVIPYSDSGRVELSRTMLKNEMRMASYEGISGDEIKESMVVRVLASQGVSEKKKQILVNALLALPDESPEDFDALKRASIMLDLIYQLTQDRIHHVIDGAHVELDDCGKIYRVLHNHGLLNPRMSSHHRNNKVSPDASFQGGEEFFPEFLVGLKKNDAGEDSTWFQLERNSTKGLLSTAMHLVDWFEYKLTGENLGPLKSRSPRGDWDPIKIPRKQHVDCSEVSH